MSAASGPGGLSAAPSASFPGTAAVGASTEHFAIVVFGASGDLAKKKTYPAVFELFAQDLLPSKLVIFGFARSKRSDDAFRETIRPYLKGADGAVIEDFLSKCFYRNGKGYDDEDAFKALIGEVEAKSEGTPSNRVFYMAIPPVIFGAAGALIRKHGMSATGWSRVVVEKPFGKDSASNALLNAELGRYFTEEEVYRIDHYLGKEMVQNLMVLRFGNAVFEPLWNRHSIKNVTITFKEPYGIPGRAGYFDQYGIIRDVMQNHLTQVLSIVAMEAPVTLSAEDVRDEKVKLLRCVQPVRADDVVVGQYMGDADHKGYLEEEGVPPGSTTPTFATAVLFIHNQRWKGVPFILKCGKGLNERKAEVRVQFRDAPHFLYTYGGGSSTQVKATSVDKAIPRPDDSASASASASAAESAAAASTKDSASAPSSASGSSHPLAPTLTRSSSGRGFDGGWHVSPDAGPSNELVIRIQPKPSVYLKVISKMPGLDNVVGPTELNLNISSRFPTRKSPEAYARLILDVFRGDQSQFVRADELAAAWAVFTPILHHLEAKGHTHARLDPVPLIQYRFGSRGPPESDTLARKHGFRFDRSYGHSWHRHVEGAEMARVRKALEMPKARLEECLRAFQGEMRKGLASKATIPQIYTYVDEGPSGDEEGAFWGLDIGGTNLRLVKYEVAPAGAASPGSAAPARSTLRKVEGKSFVMAIPPGIKKASGEELFDWMAECCSKAGVRDGEPIGFCFSFPYQQAGINRGFLLYWTKEFSNPGVALDELEGSASADDVAAREVASLLEGALARRGGPKARVTAVINDTVGTLMSGLRTDERTQIGLILGTGTNAAYVERKRAISKVFSGDDVAEDEEGIVCMEWGGFSQGSDHSKLPAEAERLIPLASFDLTMLSETDTPGSQVFEKLISGKYLGSIARCVLRELHQAKEIFESCGDLSGKTCRLLRPAHEDVAEEGDEAEDSHGSFSTKNLFQCIRDTSGDSIEVRRIIRKLGVPTASDQDVHLVKEVCTLVARRAARLVGMALSAVLRHTGKHRSVSDKDARPAVIAVDGSVFAHNTDFDVSSGPEGFKSWTLEAMHELGVSADLSPIDSASFEGAAVVAAIAAAQDRLGKGKLKTADEAAAVCKTALGI